MYFKQQLAQFKFINPDTQFSVKCILMGQETNVTEEGIHLAAL